MNKQRNRYLWLGILLCGCIALLSGCRLGRRATPTPIVFQVPASLAGTPAAPTQSTAVVQIGTVVQHTTYTGQVVPGRQEDLSFHSAGQVTKIYVQDGDKVKGGDVLAILEQETFELDLETAQLNVELAQQDLERAQKAFVPTRRQAELKLALAKLHATDKAYSENSNRSSIELINSRKFRRRLPTWSKGTPAEKS